MKRATLERSVHGRGDDILTHAENPGIVVLDRAAHRHESVSGSCSDAADLARRDRSTDSCATHENTPIGPMLENGLGCSKRHGTVSPQGSVSYSGRAVRSVLFERLEIRTNLRQVDYERVPDRSEVGPLVVMREAISHPLDQRPRHLGMPRSGLNTQTSDVLADLDNHRLRRETRHIVGVANIPLVAAYHEIRSDAAQASDFTQHGRIPRIHKATAVASIS